MQKMIIISAPSGAGKTTIVKYLLNNIADLEFSISATNRKPRVNETNKQDYYFLSTEEFKKNIEENKFIEWEEVYQDTFYGTLIFEVERIWKMNKTAIFDVDVKGGLNIKKKYKQAALSIFIMPPSLNILEERLKQRNSNEEHDLNRRLAKAEHELKYASQFDTLIVNDSIERSTKEAFNVVMNFLNSN